MNRGQERQNSRLPALVAFEAQFARGRLKFAGFARFGSDGDRNRPDRDAPIALGGSLERTVVNSKGTAATGAARWRPS